jgi:hypothetical protein
MGSRLDFIHAVLLDPRVSRPLSTDNEDALLAWQASEFGDSSPNPAAFNPFATTQPKPGASPYNTFGAPGAELHVWNYPDWPTGVEATVDTLTNGYYQPILDALTNAHDATAVVNAIHESPWGSKPTDDTLATVRSNRDHYANLAVDDGAPQPGPGPAPGGIGHVEMPTLSQGASGRDVRIVQALTGAAVDGEFGPQTEGAVRSFQTSSGIGVDGVVGPQTWTALVQRGTGATVDGSYGPQTTAAVKAFQERAGIAVDGIAGPDTFAHLAGV